MATVKAKQKAVKPAAGKIKDEAKKATTEEKEVKLAEKPAEVAAVEPVKEAAAKAVVAVGGKPGAEVAAGAAEKSGDEAKKAGKTAAAKPAAAAKSAAGAEVKAEEKKTPVKKAPAKKAAPKKAAVKAEVKEEVKAEEKKVPAKKAPAKKAAPKKAEVKAEVKEEVKAEEKKAEEPKAEVKAEEKKAPVKKAPAKKAAPKKAAPKAEEKKVEEKKAEEKKVEEPKAEVKEEVKVEVKPEISAEEKAAQYAAFELNTCIDMAKAMGIAMNYDDYAAMLMAESDITKIADAILEKYPVDASKLNFEEDGYDLTLLPILIERVGSTMDVKAGDFKGLADDITAALDLKLTDDGAANADVYNTLFDLVRRVLVLGQKRDIHSLEEIDKMVPADVYALIYKFMDTAYDVLKNWQYKDVKYYEGFIYEVLSQFEDLHQPLDNRAMMDVADLLILHGDFGLGDANYNYVLRENQIKDQIYYRFANIYKDIDRNKARAIANGALQVVDGRYDYYPKIVEILES